MAGDELFFTPESELMERRRFLRNAAVIASVTPVILSVGAGTAGAQAPGCSRTPRPSGCNCVGNQECAAGLKCIGGRCQPCIAKNAAPPGGDCLLCCSGTCVGSGVNKKCS